MPLLKGKRTSKIRPEFVIFDPQMDANAIVRIGSSNGSASSRSTTTSGPGRSDSSGGSDFEDGPPRTPRRKKTKGRKKGSHAGRGTGQIAERVHDDAGEDDLSYLDTLPESVKLVQVTSNIWGTKFKIHGLAKTVPANLGQVSYKTSLLHLQPRQMTLVITELRDDFVADPDPNFNPHVFSEDEEEHHRVPSSPRHHRGGEAQPTTSTAVGGGAPMIAPMSPRPTRFNNKFDSTFGGTSAAASTALEANLARAESYEDDAASDSNEEHAKALVAAASKPGPSYASLVTQYSRSSSSSGQSRHAISPLCCEGSVPTLQSPKNAVAPVDIIFDRPPANHSPAGVMSFHSSEYAQPSHSRNDKPMSTVHAKRKDLQFIDEESTLMASKSGSTAAPQPPAIVPMYGDAIPRSCSVGYLDSVQLVPSDSALSMLRREAPHKRLILVDKRPQKKKPCVELKVVSRLQKCGKSKSLELFDLSKVDLQQTSRADNALTKSRQSTSTASPDVKDSANADTSTSSRLTGLFMSKTPLLHRKERPKACGQCKTISPTVNSTQTLCTQCRAAQSTIEVDATSSREPSASSLPHPPRRYDLKSLFDLARGSPSKSAKRRTEVIKSYADSPLFNRKHRFQNQEPVINKRSLSMGRKSSAKRRSSTESDNDGQGPPTDVNPIVSGTRSAITSTLDNIMGRGRFSSSAQNSPVAQRKEKRYATSSPIRQILNSPLLSRRSRKNKQLIESSDDELQGSAGEESNSEQVVGSTSGTPRQYRDLETFQKAQLRQKVSTTLYSLLFVGRLS